MAGARRGAERIAQDRRRDGDRVGFGPGRQAVIAAGERSGVGPRGPVVAAGERLAVLALCPVVAAGEVVGLRQGGAVEPSQVTLGTRQVLAEGLLAALRLRLGAADRGDGGCEHDCGEKGGAADHGFFRPRERRRPSRATSWLTTMNRRG